MTTRESPVNSEEGVRLTLENIASLAQVDPGIRRTLLEDPAAVPLETRYKIGTRCSYLLGGIAQARGALLGERLTRARRLLRSRN
jgi:hypothetical protein